MKILACTDGSKHGDKALRKAVELAKKEESVSVTVLYVDEFERYSYFLDPFPSAEEIKEKKKEQEKKLLEEAKKLFEKENVEINTETRDGHPSTVITEMASKENFDLIVVGSRGYSGIEKLALGSVSNNVVQEADTDVLVVK